MASAKPSTINEYIAAFPQEVQAVLKQVYNVIKQAAPDAEESISYAIPTFKLKGKPIIYFAAFKTHIGLYATPTGHEAFKDELSQYKQGRGSVQFPLDKAMPLELIMKIVEYRVREILR